MLAIERRNAILEQLNLNGKVIVADLSRTFDVTEETIRRDLEKLEKEGFAKKTYGGAVLKDSIHTDLPFTVRKRTNVEFKQNIAAKVAALIQDGDYLMLDSSSTAVYIAKSIKDRKNITLITNSVEILLELADKEDWNVLSTGGSLRKGALSLVGATAEHNVRSFHVDLAVCSCKGLDLTMGITDSNEQDSAIKQAFFASADRKILAVDSTKFDQTSFVKVSDIKEIDTIVTDCAPADHWLEYFETNKLEIIY